jgi:hypothetical protein
MYTVGEKRILLANGVGMNHDDAIVNLRENII